MKKKFILDTKTHYKPTETFQYIYPFYFGPPSDPGVKKGFIKGEAILGDPGADSWVTRKSRRPSLKPRPNDRNMPTQHIATLLGATCCVRLATLLRHVATC